MFHSPRRQTSSLIILNMIKIFYELGQGAISAYKVIASDKGIFSLFFFWRHRHQHTWWRNARPRDLPSTYCVVLAVMSPSAPGDRRGKLIPPNPFGALISTPKEELTGESIPPDSFSSPNFDGRGEIVGKLSRHSRTSKPFVCVSLTFHSCVCGM